MASESCGNTQASYNKQKKILIVGDYDVDGATSTAPMVRVLKKFAVKTVDYLVPNRFQFGYGLSPELVEFAVKHKNPDLIITVDNGIASIEGFREKLKIKYRSPSARRRYSAQMQY